VRLEWWSVAGLMVYMISGGMTLGEFSYPGCGDIEWRVRCTGCEFRWRGWRGIYRVCGTERIGVEWSCNGWIVT
jgi:hypothetical protein